MLKRIVFTVVTTLLLIGINVLPVFAWQFTMNGVDGTLTENENYNITVEFEGVATDYLDQVSFAIQWDTDLLEITDLTFSEYERGSGLSKYTLWGESAFTYITDDISQGFLYDVSSETEIDHMGEFYPVATGETLMMTFTFTALKTGDYEDLANFIFTSQNDLTEIVDINDTVYNAEYGELVIYKEHSTSVMTASPVPVPAAVWLLGSGLLGLIGFKRKNGLS